MMSLISSPRGDRKENTGQVLVLEQVLSDVFELELMLVQDTLDLGGSFLQKR